MIAFFLVFVSRLFDEIGTSIGKHQAQLKQESIYTMGFLKMLWGTIFFLCIAFFIRKDFIFSLASLPTFGPRLILEIIQYHVTLKAIVTATRSTYGFIRILTIPLLLVTDIILGYTLGFNQILGIGVIVVALIILFLRNGLKSKGKGLVLFTAINAVATISLFKYDITNFNSVEAEQSIVLAVLMVYMFVMAVIVAKENPLKFLKQPIFLSQSLSGGMSDVVMSFTYLFAPASVITTLKRALSIFFATISGHVYFHEKKLALKLVMFFLISIGLLLLVF